MPAEPAAEKLDAIGPKLEMLVLPEDGVPEESPSPDAENELEPPEKLRSGAPMDEAAEQLEEEPVLPDETDPEPDSPVTGAQALAAERPKLETPPVLLAVPVESPPSAPDSAPPFAAPPPPPALELLDEPPPPEPDPPERTDEELLPPETLRDATLTRPDRLTLRDELAGDEPGRM